MAMQTHQADAIYSDDAILSGLKAQDPNTVLVGDATEKEYYAVGAAPAGTPHASEGLVKQVNSTMERIRSDGTLSELYNTWMRQYLGPPAPLPFSYRTQQESEELQKIRQAAQEDAE